MCQSSFCNTIYWRDCLCSIVCSHLLCEISIGHKGMGLFLGFLFCSIDLCKPVHMPVLGCFDYSDLVWNIFLHTFTLSFWKSSVLRWVLVDSIYIGHFFLSFQLPYVFWFEHLIHLTLNPKFKVIIDRYLFIAIFLLYLCFSLYFFFLKKAL